MCPSPIKPFCRTRRRLDTRSFFLSTVADKSDFAAAAVVVDVIRRTRAPSSRGPVDRKSTGAIWRLRCSVLRRLDRLTTTPSATVKLTHRACQCFLPASFDGRLREAIASTIAHAAESVDGYLPRASKPNCRSVNAGGLIYSSQLEEHYTDDTVSILHECLNRLEKLRLIPAHIPSTNECALHRRGGLR